VLVLAHEAPAVVARRLASRFYDSPEVKVYLHHDCASPHHDRAAFEAAIPTHVRWQWLPDAVEGRWGEWSLVEGTLRLVEAALADADFAPERLLLASGSCRPIRPLASLQAYLRERPTLDFIEAHDIALGRWVKGGLERERFEWFFPFNYQTRRAWFERATALQRALGLRRRLPAALRPHFGSQWFCLRASTAAEVVALLRRPDLARFLRSTWIPDEFAIQSAVATLRPAAELARHGLTYVEFDALGKPLVLEDWHLDHVRRQPFFFARKVSPDAVALERALDNDVSGTEADLAYFAAVGHPTPDFGAHLAAVRDDPGRRARAGGFPERLGGPMAGNRRRYYVLYGSARDDVGRLLADARSIGGAAELPILQFPFDRAGPRLLADRLSWRGFSPRDRQRIAYDPCGALHELVQADPRECVAFGLDVSAWSWVRDFVVRDPNAVLVDCDPPGASRAQRAALLLSQTGGAHETWLREPAREALRRGLPLPQDWFARQRALGKTRCAFARLTDPGFADDMTWQALTAAAARGDDPTVLPRDVALAIAGEEE